MNTERNQFVLPEGAKEIVIREGEAPKLLDPKPPIKTDIAGTIGAPVAFLEKRVGELEQHRCNVIVNREKVSILLTINEDNAYLVGEVCGKLQFHPKFVAFGINSGKLWQPTELGLFMKMNRSFFADKKANMELVTKFMNFKANVNQQVERSTKQNGGFTDNFGQIVESNMPESFKLTIPLFKGMPAEELEVETFASIDGRDVQISLISAGAECTLESIRDSVIDEQLEKIREIAPEIVIIEE